MKFALLFMILALMAPACGLREREKELDKKVATVNQKEQELLLKEQSLQLKEDELFKREKLLDSTSKNPSDSFMILHPQLTGKWNVTMRCTETDCPGSAVGDTKIEQWQISYYNGGIVVQAFSGNKLVRVYSGSSNGGIVELSTQPDNTDPLLSTTMIVRFQEIKEKEIRGQREIIRPEKCHIIYALEMKKE